MKIYIALNSSPDYTAPAPSFKSAHYTLEGAIKSLYPNDARFHKSFTKVTRGDKVYWNGPDGFGLVRLVEIEP